MVVVSISVNFYLIFSGRPRWSTWYNFSSCAFRCSIMVLIFSRSLTSDSSNYSVSLRASWLEGWVPLPVWFSGSGIGLAMIYLRVLLIFQGFCASPWVCCAWENWFTRPWWLYNLYKAINVIHVIENTRKKISLMANDWEWYKVFIQAYGGLFIEILWWIQEWLLD